MKVTVFNKIKNLLATAICISLFLLLVPCVAFAEETDNDIAIIMDLDFSRDVAIANYKEINELDDSDYDALQDENWFEYEDDIMFYDGNPPQSYHNLDASDYEYRGYSTRNRLFSSKYFSTTGDGYLYFEGFAKTFHTRNNNPQDFNFEIWSRSTNQCVGTFSIDYRNVLSRGTRYSTFYYRFCVYNLNPNELYYIAFTDQTEATGFETYGYVSHNWTNYYVDDPRYDF